MVPAPYMQGQRGLGTDDDHITAMYFTNGDAYTLGINREYEYLTGIALDDVKGKHMQELEKIFFRPSVTLKVLEQKKTITTIQQLLLNNKKLLVTGNPVYNHEGKITMVITLVKLLEDNGRSLPTMSFSKPKYKTFGKMVFNSTVMGDVIDKVAKVALTGANVIITGESGVGKELIANTIHNLSPRKDKPFVVANLAAIPENLMESELFGYTRGAYTGADPKGKVGLAKTAAGGTLFLDEIGDLPLSFQVKLLRFLEQKEIMPLGANRAERVDVRVIAATNRNLAQMVREGTFRRDLFYRLNVFNIHVPPLRARKEDIEALTFYFLEKANKQYKTGKTISPDALRLLCSYNWPGNIRELKNMIERLVVLYPSCQITPKQVELELSGCSDLSETIDDFESRNLNEAVSRFEKEFIIRSLKKYGDPESCAMALGVHRTTLMRKMRRYGIRL